MKQKLIYAILPVVLIVAGGAGFAQAEVIGPVEADIPFQFEAGLQQFPAGQYTIHSVGAIQSSTMEISSADGKFSALFQVQRDISDSTPRDGKLVFERDGNRYSLARIFDAGDKDGDLVIGYKSVLERNGEKAQVQQASGTKVYGSN